MSTAYLLIMSLIKCLILNPIDAGIGFGVSAMNCKASGSSDMVKFLSSFQVVALSIKLAIKSKGKK